MKLSFRWYGETDPVQLCQIRQIPGMKGIVTALYDVPVGEVWPLDAIRALQKPIEEAGLTISVIESVPVHEDIKMGLPSRDRYIENYQQTLRNLAAANVPVVCYNFMPLFDWVRTTLSYELPDGSNTLAYDDAEIAQLDLLSGEGKLPAWNVSYTKDELHRLYKIFRDMSEETLWENLTYFLQAIMPVADEVGIKMAIHPDDPPWSVLQLPRIVTNRANLDRLLAIHDSPNHGLCLCTGSLGCNPANDIVEMARHFAAQGRVNFVHMRNVKVVGERSFYESGHLSETGSVDMYQVMQALRQSGFDGPFRPDHGRMIWEETGNPGYGLYDRALGAAYLNGLLEAVDKQGGKAGV
ncbi:mannonate dehydratase [Alicyclobacillus fodiniaquatilis]|uniref:Mannonate dehydratase n=1 Tax=Alicyclobacillus fodiniaquatilis TaxID=1661150 RepID=A0ABW4JL36_9BACL